MSLVYNTFLTSVFVINAFKKKHLVFGCEKNKYKCNGNIYIGIIHGMISFWILNYFQK